MTSTVHRRPRDDCCASKRSLHLTPLSINLPRHQVMQTYSPTPAHPFASPLRSSRRPRDDCCDQPLRQNSNRITGEQR
jgi:hypothetical protein